MGLFDIFKSKEKREQAKKYRIGMEKTRKSAFARFFGLFESRSKKLQDDFFDELEEIFVMSDIGVDTVVRFVDELKVEAKKRKVETVDELKEVVVDKMLDLYLKGEEVSPKLNVAKEGLSVYLFVGVNGVGKTTTIAKIAFKLIKEGKRVICAAGDTFRAGAKEQLSVWGERIGFRVVSGTDGSDPASVVYDALQIAKNEGYDYLLVDTAGRLQTKVNLMKELEKIKRVISREVTDAPHDTLLVIDSTTGQNGLSQAKAFIEATDVTGVVLTKLDGTAKGGIVLAIRDIYNIPIKFVGLGEKMEDLEYFDIEKYVYGLFADIIDEE